MDRSPASKWLSAIEDIPAHMIEASATDVRPSDICARFADGVNVLRFHLLEAGDAAKPCVLMPHGFPELTCSWRKVMAPLAQTGCYVVALDQRGYGHMTAWDADYDGDVAPFCLMKLVRDMVGLIATVGHTNVKAVVGHHFGALVAVWCPLMRPHLFRSVVLTGALFAAPPSLPAQDLANIHRILARTSDWPIQ